MLLKHFLIYTTLFHSFNSERNFRVQITKVDCINSVPGFFKSINCTITDRNNVSYIGMWMELPKPIAAVMIRVVLEASMPKRSKLNLLDAKMDACVFFKMSQKQEIMQIAKKYIGNFVNRKFICPLEANFTYIIKDAFVNVEDLASFTPELNFRFKLFIFEMNKITFKILSEGKIIYNQNIRNTKKVRI